MPQLDAQTATFILMAGIILLVAAHQLSPVEGETLILAALIYLRTCREKA